MLSKTARLTAIFFVSTFLIAATVPAQAGDYALKSTGGVTIPLNLESGGTAVLDGLEATWVCLGNDVIVWSGGIIFRMVDACKNPAPPNTGDIKDSGGNVVGTWTKGDGDPN